MTVRPLPLFRRFLARDSRGVAATELAMLAPVLALLLAGAIDVASSIYARFGLNSSVNVGAYYALNNASSANSSNGATLASQISRLTASARETDWANVTATVNAGPTSVTSNGTTTASGSAAAADSCYCPTLADGAVSWGSAKTCGASCADGGVAGKFVLIQARRDFMNILGFLSDGQSSVQTLVRVQ